MALTLAQAATLSENDLQVGVIERFIIDSPVLDRLALKPIDGNAYSYTSPTLDLTNSAKYVDASMLIIAAK